MDLKRADEIAVAISGLALSLVAIVAAILAVIGAGILIVKLLT